MVHMYSMSFLFHKVNFLDVTISYSHCSVHSNRRDLDCMMHVLTV